jgi:hypothetical protein
MSEIADFLRARYAERRAIAKGPPDSAWRVTPEADRIVGLGSGKVVARVHGEDLGGLHGHATLNHIAINDPEAAIADLDAKLAIVKHMDEMLKFAEGDTEVDHYGALDAADQTLRLLAQPFAGHPDHKGEEWAP